MRIGIDIQACQSEGSKRRGIGRYSLNIIKSLINNYPEDEYFLFANASLCNLRNEFSEELYHFRDKVFYIEWFSPGPTNDDFRSGNSRNSLAKNLRSYSLSLLNLDIILITSFFEGFTDNTVTSIDKTYDLPPIVCIFYDLIPLLNPDQYLYPNLDFSLFYYEKLRQLQKFDLLLAISNSSRNEAINNLSIEEDQVINISSACDRSLFNNNIENNLESANKFRDLGQFILYTGAGDPRKNLHRLIQAYSKLPINLLLKHKLVLAGNMIEAEVELIYRWIDELALPRDYVSFLGYVSDEDLSNLYKQCYLFVFPSLHEGFGLPVLEALSCGAAVIGSNTTSIPEILKNHDALFDPLNVDSIYNLICNALTNNEFYLSLKKLSFQVASEYSWESTAQAAHKALLLIAKNYKIKTEKLKLNSSSKRSIEILNKYLKRFHFRFFYQKQSDFYKQVLAAVKLINKQILSHPKYKEVSLNKPLWEIQGPFDSSYSLAILNRQFAFAMNDLNYRIRLRCTEGFGDYKPNIDFINQYNKLKYLFMRSETYLGKPSIVSRNMYPPRVIDLDTSQLNLLHAYGWEESSLPFKWVQRFNKYLDGITVMSKQVKKILIDNGVSIPIEISQLGLDHLNNIDIDDPIQIQAKNFKFLHISSCFPRKGIRFLLQAYADNFNESDDVSLIIKTFNNPHNNIHSVIYEFKTRYPSLGDIIVIEKDLTEDRIKSLFSLCDCFVAPSLGEGFCLPIGEAMSLGVPVITTGWGGQTDFCSSMNSWLIDYKFCYSHTHFKLFSSIWVEPSIVSLGKSMKEVFNLPDISNHPKVKEGLKIAKDLTWKKVAEKNIQFTNSIISHKQINEPRVGLVSTWNQKCGISNYSHSLFQNLIRKLNIFAPMIDSSPNENYEFLTRCWRYEEDNLNNLLDNIMNVKITTVIIQFNFGFFNFYAFKDLINSLKNNSISVIIIFHSTKEPSLPNKSLNILVESFLKCDRLLVHTPSDLNNFKNLGLVDNVTLFPHGISCEHVNLDFVIPKYRKYLPFVNKKSLNLASFGFCLPNKGFLELIKSTSYLKNKGVMVYLNIYASNYNEYSISLMRDLESLVLDLGMAKMVEINSSYLSEEEIITNLSKADLIVYPYQSSNESSSAAIREALASLKPIAATPLDIFEDVESLVYTLPGFDAESLASGIYDWYMQEKDKNYTELTNDLDRRKSWIRQHDFSDLSTRLDGMIKALENDYS